MSWEESSLSGSLVERFSGEAFLGPRGQKEGLGLGMPWRQGKAGGRKPGFERLRSEILQVKSEEYSSLTLVRQFCGDCHLCAASYHGGQTSSLCLGPLRCLPCIRLLRPSYLGPPVYVHFRCGTCLGW